MHRTRLSELQIPTPLPTPHCDCHTVRGTDCQALADWHMSTIIAPPTMPETATTVPQCEARLDQPRNYLNVEHAIKSWLCFGRCAGEKQQQIPETLLAWSGRPRYRPSQKTFSKYRSWITKPTITTKLMHLLGRYPANECMSSTQAASALTLFLEFGGDVPACPIGIVSFAPA